MIWNIFWPALHHLALVHVDALQVAALLRAQLDVLDGANLGHVFAGHFGAAAHRRRDGERGLLFLRSFRLRLAAGDRQNGEAAHGQRTYAWSPSGWSLFVPFG